MITSHGGGLTATLNVAENASSVTTVTASDSDLPAQTLTYSISGGADAAKFSIGSVSGVLSFVTPPDFETPTDSNSDNVYQVTVLVNDGLGGTDSQDISITVTAANDNSPIITGGMTWGVSEFAMNGTAVGTLTASDVDAGTTLSGWTIISGNAGGVFSINAVTGQISVVDNTLLDFETTASYLLGVTVSDGINTSAAETVSILVSNEDDATVGLPLIAGTPQEDQTLVADTSGIVDQDGIASLSYQWLRDGAAVSGATSSSYTLGDSDVGSTIRLQVMVTDGLGNVVGPLSSADTSPVANVNDIPVGLPIVTGVWEENQTVTATAGSVTDADGLGIFTYQWLRNGSAIVGAVQPTIR